jgi:DNA topoisomerase III
MPRSASTTTSRRSSISVSRAKARKPKPVDFSGQEPLGACPKCGASVYEHGNAYVCERSVGPDKKPAISAAARSSCSSRWNAPRCRSCWPKATDLLTGFVSARTKRKFSAFLVRDKDGKVGFEFEPRPKAAPKRAAPAPGKELGKHPRDGKPISLKSGRFGPYVQHGKLNATLPKEMSPDSGDAGAGDRTAGDQGGGK